MIIINYKITTFNVSPQMFQEVEADDVSRFALSTKTEDVEKLLLDVSRWIDADLIFSLTPQRF